MEGFVESAQINASHLINAKGGNNLTLIRQGSRQTILDWFTLPKVLAVN